MPYLASLRQARVCVALEQTQEHDTLSANLRRYMGADPRVDVTWVNLPPATDPGWLGRLSGRGSSRELGPIQQGLDHELWDALVVYATSWTAWSPAWFQRVPVVLLVDMTPIQRDELTTWGGRLGGPLPIVRALSQRRTQEAFHAAEWVLPWSSWARDSLERDYAVPVTQLRVLPPGIDLAWWRPAPNKAHNGRARILFVGRDWRRQGGDWLLDTYRQRWQDRAELHLVTSTGAALSGDGVHVHRDLMPNEARLASLYRRCDLFVLPARAGGFSFASLEAMATGLPVVLTDVGSAADLVTPDVTGVLVPPGDEDGLVQAIDRLLDDLPTRLKMGVAARRVVEERFSAAANTRQLVDRVLKAIEARSPVIWAAPDHVHSPNPAMTWAGGQ
ncbi:MAG: glycosyltransferase family 4 protein [Chloroflexi bacterium]|nr:glycosyltransferase family 4 protein [Chloroflexota bacterium]MBU1747640.1 glycosyltransferase family 4 protein [Chloroflexota bacterium]